MASQYFPFSLSPPAGDDVPAQGRAVLPRLEREQLSREEALAVPRAERVTLDGSSRTGDPAQGVAGERGRELITEFFGGREGRGL